jgi:exo-beta-1,3-glucanase (GH17 family)
MRIIKIEVAHSLHSEGKFGYAGLEENGTYTRVYDYSTDLSLVRQTHRGTRIFELELGPEYLGKKTNKQKLYKFIGIFPDGYQSRVLEGYSNADSYKRNQPDVRISWLILGKELTNLY